MGDVPGLYAGGDIMGTGWPSDAAPAVNGGRFALIQMPSWANPMALHDAKTIHAKQNRASVLYFFISVQPQQQGIPPLLPWEPGEESFIFLKSFSS